MDAREQRGLVIAALSKLNRTENGWMVPSQSGAAVYTVNPEEQSCTCPDNENGHKCKHLYAVEFVIKREYRPDGTMIETRQLLFEEKKVYRQDWPKYDRAQMTEKTRFLDLLRDLVRGVTDFPQPKTGRRHAPLADMIFASALKVYTGMSFRRFACDLKDTFDKGYLSELMHSVRVCAYFENPIMTPAIEKLIVQSSLPLRSVETTFAPDSTGFSTCRFTRWFDEKYGITRSGHDWVKAHAITGTQTNVVTAVIIEGQHANDCPMFKPLVEKTAENFTIRQVPADKAYLSRENLELVHNLGGEAFIPFKSTSVQGEAGSLWEKMYLYYNFRRDEFLKHYHQRSNAESTFSMVKAKFGDSVRSKTDVAMKNETLLKFLCHNVCVVHQSQVELGIEPVFWEPACRLHQVS